MNNFFDPDCPDCKGTGDADSGGIHPWGAPAYIRCHCEITMKLHPTTVMGLKPTEELGRQIMALRYDLIAPVLEGMRKEAFRQSREDEKAGKVKLAYRMREMSFGVENAATALDNVLSICKEFIDAEKAAVTVTFGTPMYVERIGERIGFSHEGKEYVLPAQTTGFVIGAKFNAGNVTLVYQ
jgi:hypothetical protein